MTMPDEIAVGIRIAQEIAERKERLREAAQAVVDMWVRDGHSTETGAAIQRLRVVLDETQ